MVSYTENDYREVMEQALTTMDKYLDYASNQPVRDGQEMRDFFDDLNED